ESAGRGVIETDGGGAVAVPIPRDRKPSRGRAGERERDVGASRRVAVSQVERAGRRIVEADGADPITVPVPTDRLTSRSRRSEHEGRRGARGDVMEPEGRAGGVVGSDPVDPVAIPIARKGRRAGGGRDRVS